VRYVVSFLGYMIAISNQVSVNYRYPSIRDISDRGMSSLLRNPCKTDDQTLD